MLLWFEMSCLINDIEMIGEADDTNQELVHEEGGIWCTRRETLEMEEKPSSMAVTVQIQVAKTLETQRVVKAQ